MAPKMKERERERERGRRERENVANNVSVFERESERKRLVKMLRERASHGGVGVVCLSQKATQRESVSVKD